MGGVKPCDSVGLNLEGVRHRLTYDEISKNPLVQILLQEIRIHTFNGCFIS